MQLTSMEEWIAASAALGAASSAFVEGFRKLTPLGSVGFRHYARLFDGAPEARKREVLGELDQQALLRLYRSRQESKLVDVLALLLVDQKGKKEADLNINAAQGSAERERSVAAVFTAMVVSVVGMQIVAWALEPEGRLTLDRHALVLALVAVPIAPVSSDLIKVLQTARSAFTARFAGPVSGGSPPP